MFVVKRDGRKASIHFDKITNRVTGLAEGLHDACDPFIVAQKVIQGVHAGCTTTELDELAAETAASMTTNHPDYATLAARLAVASLVDSTQASFSATMKALYENVNARTGENNPLISDDVFKCIMKNAEALDAAIDHECDFNYDFFGFKTLERSYLLRVNDQVTERPQHMLMRVAVGIHKADTESAIRTYKLMSRGYFTHATPTLFNAGTPQPQMSSCFLVAMKEDSITGIFDALKECALISKSAGGIGINVHNVRASGSYIKGLNAEAYGLVPMLRVFNDTARFVTQGGGKRKGSFAIYLEPWHADVFDFLELRKNHGKEEARARDLFYGLWIPDLFMKRCEVDGEWTLMCPSECPGLADCWGEAFEALYTRYEKEGRGRKTIRAQELWSAVLESQIETGMPYMLFKDAANGKSNQQHLGTIKSSNLCTEIIEYTAPDETAVCNLASLALPRFVVENAAEAPAAAAAGEGGAGAGGGGAPSPSSGAGLPRAQPSFTWRRTSSNNGLLGSSLRSDSCYSEDFSLSESDAEADSPPRAPLRWSFPPRRLAGSLGAARRSFDFEAFSKVVRVATRNLNRIIDGNFYPVEEARNSNLRHRPIGLGVQGLADVFILLGMPFDSPEAALLNKQIFEALYFAAMEESCLLAKEEGVHPSYPGSPVSKGILQPDMWGIRDEDSPNGGRLDWAALRRDVAQHGVRNSLLVAPMPTASTSQILGNNECFEPYTSNMYARRVLSGEFTVVNGHLLSDLMELGLWSPAMKNELIAHNGSVQGMSGVPQRLKALYKTVWEIKQRTIVDMAADRASYIDQSQSLNVHMSNATPAKLTSLHFHSWKKGLKTGLYYLRTRAAADAVKFTVDASVLKERNANLADAATAERAGREKAAAEAKAGKVAAASAASAAAVACSLTNRDDCLMCGS